jgi:hypothetical protein
MNWKGCGRKRSCPDLRYYPVICLEGLRKTTKNLSQDRRSLGRDLNPGPPEYEAGVLTTRPRRSVSPVLPLGTENWNFPVALKEIFNLELVVAWLLGPTVLSSHLRIVTCGLFHISQPTFCVYSIKLGNRIRNTHTYQSTENNSNITRL